MFDAVQRMRNKGVRRMPILDADNNLVGKVEIAWTGMARFLSWNGAAPRFDANKRIEPVSRAIGGCLTACNSR